MNDRRSDKRPWALTKIALGALVTLLAVTESVDADLGFHLATGRAVLAQGAIPARNVMTFAEPDHAWLDHSALSSVALELAHRAAGLRGTLALEALLLVATALFVLGAARRLGARPAVAAAVCALGAWAAAFRFVARPLLFSNLALAAALFACAVALERARAAEHKRAAIAASGAGLSLALGAQLHAGAVFVAIALVGMAAALALEPFVRRKTAPFLERDLARRGALVLLGAALGGIVAAGALLTLYHPFGVRVLSVPFRIGSDPYLGKHIVEFRAPYELPLRVMAPFFLYLAVAAVVVVASLRKAPLPLLLPIVFGFSLALRHGRFVDLAFVAGAPALAALASARLPRLPKEPAVAIVIALAAVLDRTSIAPPKIGLAAAVWPTPLFDAVDHAGIRGPAYVQDGWAGPFLERYWPRERVFFHPVFEAYSDEHAHLYQSIRYGEPGWEEALDRYGVALVIMKHTSEREREFQHEKPNLRQHLAASKSWAIAALDELGAVWVKRDGPNAAVAKELASGVDPDRMAFIGHPRAARAGLEVLYERGPRSVRLMILLAMARADAGEHESAKALLDEAETMAPDDLRVDRARRALLRL